MGLVAGVGWTEGVRGQSTSFMYKVCPNSPVCPTMPCLGSRFRLLVSNFTAMLALNSWLLASTTASLMAPRQPPLFNSGSRVKFGCAYEGKILGPCRSVEFGTTKVAQASKYIRPSLDEPNCTRSTLPALLSPSPSFTRSTIDVSVGKWGLAAVWWVGAHVLRPPSPSSSSSVVRHSYTSYAVDNAYETTSQVAKDDLQCSRNRI